jgi:hypothetical protein
MGKEEYKGYTIELEQDGDSGGSRDWDNLGTMMCFHRRYNLGDEHNIKAGDFNSREEIEAYIQKEYDPAVILSLYLFDHSGITMNTTGFTCPWDSGQVGWIFVSKEKARKEYGWKRLTKERLVKLTKYLVSEVDIYDQELTGDVWYYVITKEDDDNVHESLGGLYGYEYAEGEAHEMVDGIIDYENKNNGIQQKMALVCSKE